MKVTIASSGYRDWRSCIFIILITDITNINFYFHIYARFIKRLSTFYKPFQKLYSEVPLDDPMARKYSEVAIQLVDFLLRKDEVSIVLRSYLFEIYVRLSSPPLIAVLKTTDPCLVQPNAKVRSYLALISDCNQLENIMFFTIIYINYAWPKCKDILIFFLSLQQPDGEKYLIEILQDIRDCLGEVSTIWKLLGSYSRFLLAQILENLNWTWYFIWNPSNPFSGGKK